MTQKQLDARDWKAILRARTNSDGTPKPGYRRNVEAIRKIVSGPAVGIAYTIGTGIAG